MTGAGLQIGVLVFREGLEAILVLAAITASMVGPGERLRRPVALGAAVAFGAALVTWQLAVAVVDDLARSVPALELQAATGLLAIVVLLVVMNWFFHKVYWTGWISLHTNKKRKLLDEAKGDGLPVRRLRLGLFALGFTAVYREGVEVVLFLQRYRLDDGPRAVLDGVGVGLLLTAAVAVSTFVMQRHLPYRRMLVVTGVMLGAVLLVMVGEQAQEMQLVHWLPTTNMAWLARHARPWMGTWLSFFPTVETIGAQALACVLVLGSYAVARQSAPAPTPRPLTPAHGVPERR
jgi:high-affinity iron transporter